MNISRIGFGSYRVDIRSDENYNALCKAITGGINLIDTSANYYDGGSEMLIGKVISDLESRNKLHREEIIIVTKGGYIQGQNYRRAAMLKQESKLFTEVVEFQDRLWHSISPDFLEDQLVRQLRRLNQKYVDVYLLHNPEYYLDWAKTNKIEIGEAREIYYERIKRSFEFLEKKVEEGKVKYYGVSSNTFTNHSSEYNFTSLEIILDIANSISCNNHFKFIQFPLNLFEAAAVTIKNQINNTETILELASRINLNVLVNRPLNAITSKGLVRLSEFNSEIFSEKDFIRQMKLVKLMEDDLISEKLTEDILCGEDLIKAKKLLEFGNLIEENWKYFGSIEHYNDVITQNFAPKLDSLIKLFDDKINEENIKDFFGIYIKECYKLLNFVSNYYKLRAQKRSDYINSLINKNLNINFHNLTLSQKSILLINSIDGVSCVLTGLRKEKYVEDVLRVLNEEKIENAKEIIGYISEEIQKSEI